MLFLYTSIKIFDEILELAQESVYEAGRGYKLYLSDNFCQQNTNQRYPMITHRILHFRNIQHLLLGLRFLVNFDKTR